MTTHLNLMATDFTEKETVEKYSEGVLAEELALKPVILEAAGEVKGLNIADLGCGDGRYSKVFAERGAKIIAVDLSSYQIEIAKKKNSHENITYINEDVASVPGIRENFADLVLMNLVIPDIENREKLGKVVKEAARVLRQKGRAIISTLHPLYLSPDQDSSDKAVDFKKENYFREGCVYKSEAVTREGRKIVFSETHFSLNFISKKLEENKLITTRLIESRPVPEKGIFLPKYLVFECIKK